MAIGIRSTKFDTFEATLQSKVAPWIQEITAKLDISDGSLNLSFNAGVATTIICHAKTPQGVIRTIVMPIIEFIDYVNLPGSLKLRNVADLKLTKNSWAKQVLEDVVGGMPNCEDENALLTHVRINAYAQLRNRELHEEGVKFTLATQVHNYINKNDIKFGLTPRFLIYSMIIYALFSQILGCNSTPTNVGTLVTVALLHFERQRSQMQSIIQEGDRVAASIFGTEGAIHNFGATQFINRAARGINEPEYQLRFSDNGDSLVGDSTGHGLESDRIAFLEQIN